jgi:hypothetical protein
MRSKKGGKKEMKWLTEHDTEKDYPKEWIEKRFALEI